MLYICREDDKHLLPPELIKEWDEWLETQSDPGLFDAYKDKSQNPPIWKIDIFVPPHLEAKFREFLGDKYV